MRTHFASAGALLVFAATCAFAPACSSSTSSAPSNGHGNAPPTEPITHGASDAGVAAKPGADAAPRTCAAMFDISVEDVAAQACARSTDCAVCVQAVNGDGVPTMWLAQENASVCPCPKVDAGAPSIDGGGASADGGTDAAPDVTCVAMFDIANKDMADQVCAMTTDCAVCVQAVDAQGNALTWLAQENASSCPCPSPKP